MATSLAWISLRYLRSSRSAGRWLMRFVMKVPVPVAGSRICTLLSARVLPKCFCSRWSAPRMMKSTTSLGV